MCVCAEQAFLVCSVSVLRGPSQGFPFAYAQRYSVPRPTSGKPESLFPLQKKGSLDMVRGTVPHKFGFVFLCSLAQGGCEGREGRGNPGRRPQLARSRRDWKEEGSRGGGSENLICKPVSRF